MKKILIIFMLIFAFKANAQTNLQLHYDFGNGRNYLTSTLEMFKPDKWGDTFFFVDMDFNEGMDKNPSAAYMEIARCLKFWNGPLSAQVEYNGGLLLLGNNIGLPINNTYLTGVDYAWHDQAFSKFLNFKVLYKYIQGKQNSFQLTGVWNLNYFKNKLTISGFADFWKEDNVNFTKGNGSVLMVPTNTSYVFLTEPQIWYNFNKNLSVGGEVELGCNFGTIEGWKVSPTLGAKWNF